MITAALTVGLTVAWGLSTGAHPSILLPLGAAALVFLLLGVTQGRAKPIGWAVGLLGAEYAAFLVEARGGVDLDVPLVAGALILIAELACWAASLLGVRLVETTLVARTARRLALLVFGALAVGSLLLLIASTQPPGGLVMTAFGAAGASGAIAQLLLISRHREQQRDATG